MAKPTIQQLARVVTKKLATPLVFYTGDFYAYTDGAYARVDPDDFRHRVAGILARLRVAKSHYNTALVREVIAHLEVQTALHSNAKAPYLMDSFVTDDGQELPPGHYDLMTFSNGHVALPALVRGANVNDLLPHNPVFFTVNAFDFEYHHWEQCPTWLRTVNEIFEGDAERIALLQEIFGYCLEPGNPLQRFFLFEGPGGNGKGVVTRALTALLGKQNVSHVGLNLFASRFQLHPTVGKLVNISNDPSKLKVEVDGMVKQFTGQDVMHIDRKNQSVLSVEATAKLIVSCNERPEFADTSGGLWRRLVMIPFKRTFEKHEQDPDLDSKLAAELPGIFNWAVQGLARLQQAKAFTVSDVSRKAEREFRDAQNPTQVYIREGFTKDPAGSIPANDCYDAYRAAMIHGGYESVTKSAFLSEIKRQFPNVQSTQQRVKPAYGPGMKNSDNRLCLWTGIRVSQGAETGASTKSGFPRAV